jgi:hypothetical protein
MCALLHAVLSNRMLVCRNQCGRASEIEISLVITLRCSLPIARPICVVYGVSQSHELGTVHLQPVFFNKTGGRSLVHFY